MDKQNVTTLLDFSNAFNTVDFDLLIAVLRIYSQVTEWFDRGQYVEENDKIIYFRSPFIGVPQRGVLSPLLFPIIINLISQNLSHPTMYMLT